MDLLISRVLASFGCLRRCTLQNEKQKDDLYARLETREKERQQKSMGRQAGNFKAESFHGFLVQSYKNLSFCIYSRKRSHFDGFLGYLSRNFYLARLAVSVQEKRSEKGVNRLGHS